MAPRQKRDPGRGDRVQKRSSKSDLQTLLGPPPLLPGEDERVYAAIADKIRNQLAPEDFIEEILTDDYIATSWDVWRWRSAKANLVRASAHLGLGELLKPFTAYFDRNGLTKRWAQGDRTAVSQVKQHLKQMHLDDGAIVAETIGLKLRELETIENAIARAELRRNVALREIELHREALAFRLREKTQQIENANFKEIEHAEET